MGYDELEYCEMLGDELVKSLVQVWLFEDKLCPVAWLKQDGVK